jgi:hypothetical protein
MASATVGSGRERFLSAITDALSRYVMDETYESPEDNKDGIRGCSVAKII